MYLQKAIFKNVAPFGDLNLELEANQVIAFSSLNGKGKTTVLSYIADAFFEIARKGEYQDVFKDNTKYYRVTSPGGIKNSTFSIVYLRFVDGDTMVDFVEAVGVMSQEEYEAIVTFEDRTLYSTFSQHLTEELSYKGINSDKRSAQRVFDENVLTFFPFDRTEIPHWYNQQALQSHEYSQKQRYRGQLDKNIECKVISAEVANWVLDVVLDHQVYAQNSYHSNLHDTNNIILNLVMSNKVQNCRYGIGDRRRSGNRVSIVQDHPQGVTSLVSPSIFHLSSGEISLLVMFTEILRQYDANAAADGDLSLSNIKGVVVIDEVDKHLHLSSQKDILPKLIRMFPNLQFIVSSHSPFFTLGASEHLKGRFRLIDIVKGIDLPTGEVDEWNEVHQLVVSEQENYKLLFDKLNSVTVANKKLRIVTEGKNTEHIRKAINVLAPELIQVIEICTGAEGKSGSQQLKSAFEVMKTTNPQHKMLFVWDCDANGMVQPIEETDKIYKYAFVQNTGNTKVSKGIENLFAQSQFTSDLYDSSEDVMDDYGARHSTQKFSKDRFIAKIQQIDSARVFSKFRPLIDLIRTLTIEQEATDTNP